MYYFIKKSIKAVIPKKLLFKNELFFRWFHGFFYIGNKHQCTICDKKLRAFITLENEDLMCPFCGSLSRTRRLWNLLNSNKSIKNNILHFSPPRSVYRQLKKKQAINYYSTDFTDAFLADYKFDITDINQSNEKFDLIICYHILEHILEDKKAMTELYRVLKPNGVIYIQTPFKEGDIYEDYNIISPEEREQHFGQDDHVRIYSVDGLKNRLEHCNFNVSTITFSNQNDDFYLGCLSPETILIATK